MKDAELFDFIRASCKEVISNELVDLKNEIEKLKTHQHVYQQTTSADTFTFDSVTDGICYPSKRD